MSFDINDVIGNFGKLPTLKKVLRLESVVITMNTWKWFIEIPDCFKTKNLCKKVVKEEIDMFKYVPNELKMQEICENAVREDLDMLEYVPKQLKTKEMCEKAVRQDV